MILCDGRINNIKQNIRCKKGRRINKLAGKRKSRERGIKERGRREKGGEREVQFMFKTPEKLLRPIFMVKTAIMVPKKVLQVNFWLQKEAASSKTKSTPPIGALH